MWTGLSSRSHPSLDHTPYPRCLCSSQTTCWERMWFYPQNGFCNYWLYSFPLALQHLFSRPFLYTTVRQNNNTTSHKPNWNLTQLEVCVALDMQIVRRLLVARHGRRELSTFVALMKLWYDSHQSQDVEKLASIEVQQGPDVRIHLFLLDGF